MYRAAAALPYDDRELAIAGLRGQLRVMATAAGAVPDWSTLNVEGPVVRVETPGAFWSEWAATVNATGEAHDLSDRTIDGLVPSRQQSPADAVTDTAPLPCP